MDISAKLRRLVPEQEPETYRSIMKLAHGLYRLYDHNTIILSRARDGEELLPIVSIRGLVQALRVILLIPDRDRKTIPLAHRLQPRFLSNSKNNFSDAIGMFKETLECMGVEG
jgi:hypothetical protein